MATKRAQARIVHGEAVRMVAARRTSGSDSALQGQPERLASNSKYEPLGKDSHTEDGLNPSAAMVDRLHARQDARDAQRHGDGDRGPAAAAHFRHHHGRRRRPTTVCQEMHDYAVKVLEGQVEDDSLFTYIAAIDAGDDWKDEACWPKANPNLGVSVKVNDLRRKREGRRDAERAACFAEKHLDEWVQSVEVWLPDDRWMSRPTWRPPSRSC